MENPKRKENKNFLTLLREMVLFIISIILFVLLGYRGGLKNELTYS